MQGRGLCVTFCPKHILQMAPVRINAKGYSPGGVHRPEPVHRLRELCAHVPDVVIKVEK